jgi:hypothetical protein
MAIFMPLYGRGASQIICFVMVDFGASVSYEEAGEIFRGVYDDCRKQPVYAPTVEL